MSSTYAKAAMSGGAALLVGGIIVSACAPAPEQPAQPTPEALQQATMLAPTVPPAVSVNALMVSSTDHAGHIIWDAAVTPPKTDNDWLELEYHGIQLSAIATHISLGGTGEADAGWAKLPDWKRFAQEMSEQGVAVVGAARSRNLDAIKAVGDRMVVTCEGCHKEFKPTLPTEGLIHKVVVYPR